MRADAAAALMDPPPLPPGWSEGRDPQTGTPYYMNPSLNLTQWHRPGPAPPPAPLNGAPPMPQPPPAPPPQPVAPAPAPLPPGWDHWTDPATGRPVFRNLSTMVAQWDDPRNAAYPAPPPQPPAAPHAGAAYSYPPAG